MRFKIGTAVLIASLQKLSNIVEKKPSMPILSNILIKTLDANTIQFSATDLEISLRTELEAEVEASGLTTVSAKTLLEVVRELPHRDVFLETTDGNRLLVYAARSRFELQTLPHEDFPHLQFQEDPAFCKADAEVLKKALGKVFYAIPLEEDRFNIPGLYWHPATPEFYRFVGCDGHRLAYYAIPKSSFPSLELDRNIIIPRKGAQEIIRILEKQPEVLIAWDEKGLTLKIPKTMMRVRLLDSEMPEYQLIIPEERPFSFQINRELLLSAVKRVAVLTDNRWRHVRFVVKENSLELESGSPDVGYASDVLEMEYQGEEFSLAFNARYVLDTLQSMESENVKVEWLDGLHGGVFWGCEELEYFSLIMPMIVGP